MLSAREMAKSGWEVTLFGLTSGEPRREFAEPIGQGRLEVVRIRRNSYEKQRLAKRLVWTIVSNLLLMKAAFGSMRRGGGRLFSWRPPIAVSFFLAPDPSHQEKP